VEAHYSYAGGNPTATTDPTGLFYMRLDKVAETDVRGRQFLTFDFRIIVTRKDEIAIALYPAITLEFRTKDRNPRGELVEGENAIGFYGFTLAEWMFLKPVGAPEDPNRNLAIIIDSLWRRTKKVQIDPVYSGRVPAKKRISGPVTEYRLVAAFQHDVPTPRHQTRFRPPHRRSVLGSAFGLVRVRNIGRNPVGLSEEDKQALERWINDLSSEEPRVRREANDLLRVSSTDNYVRGYLEETLKEKSLDAQQKADIQSVLNKHQAVWSDRFDSELQPTTRDRWPWE
jgi:hypothetical protein